MKIMQDYKSEFLEPFNKGKPDDFRNSKGNFFEKSKQVFIQLFQNNF